MEQEYFSEVADTFLKRKEELKHRCREHCKRECDHSSEEMMECLANLMTLEYLLDNC